MTGLTSAICWFCRPAGFGHSSGTVLLLALRRQSALEAPESQISN